MTTSPDLQARLQADAAAALKAGDKERVRVLRTVSADLKKVAIDTGVDVLTADAAVAVLRRAVKARAEAAEQYEKGARKDLADREKAEIALIEGYLPKQASESDVRAAVLAVVAEKNLSGPAAMGVAIKETLVRLSGAADGKVVSRIAAEVLKKP